MDQVPPVDLPLGSSAESLQVGLVTRELATIDSHPLGRAPPAGRVDSSSRAPTFAEVTYTRVHWWPRETATTQLRPGS